MNGKEIAELIFDWADKNGMHPDDFSNLFVEELIEYLEEDK